MTRGKRKKPRRQIKKVKRGERATVVFEPIHEYLLKAPHWAKVRIDKAPPHSSES